LFSLENPNPQLDEIGTIMGTRRGGQADITYDIADHPAIEVAAAAADQPPVAIAIAGAGENWERRVQWRRYSSTPGLHVHLTEKLAWAAKEKPKIFWPKQHSKPYFPPSIPNPGHVSESMFGNVYQGSN
jgi:hypothetical protein